MKTIKNYDVLVRYEVDGVAMDATEVDKCPTSITRCQFRQVVDKPAHRFLNIEWKTEESSAHEEEKSAVKREPFRYVFYDVDRCIMRSGKSNREFQQLMSEYAFRAALGIRDMELTCLNGFPALAFATESQFEEAFKDPSKMPVSTQVLADGTIVVKQLYTSLKIEGNNTWTFDPKSMMPVKFLAQKELRPGEKVDMFHSRDVEFAKIGGYYLPIKVTSIDRRPCGTPDKKNSGKTPLIEYFSVTTLEWISVNTDKAAFPDDESLGYEVANWTKYIRLTDSQRNRSTGESTR